MRLAAGGRPAVGAGAAAGRRRVHVLAGDDAVRAGRDDRRQVDAQVLGQLAHRRLGQRARDFTGAAAAPWPFSSACDRCRARLPRTGDRRALAGAALGRGGRDAVADQDRLAALPGLSRGLRASGCCHGCWPRAAAASAGAEPAAAPPATSTAMIAVADVHRGALGEAQLAHHTVEGDGQFHGRLRGLDLADHLAVGDRVAGLDVPLEDLGLGESLAHVGHLELAEAARVIGHRRHDPLLSTPARGRRRRAPGPDPAGTRPPDGPAGTGRGSRRPAAPGPPGGRSSAR